MDATPSICYDDCDVTYQVAQSYGKTPSLCREDSRFRALYEMCRACIADNTDRSKGTVRDYIQPELEEFIDYCDRRERPTSKTEVSSSVVTVTGSQGPETSIVLVTAVRTRRVTASGGSCESCNVITITDANDKIFKITMGPQSVTGSLARDYSPTVTSKSDDPETNDTSANPNIATIVGPVVPSVVLLLLLGFLSFRWFRRRRATKEQQGPVPDEEEHKEDKPQLHSDCANRPTFELEGSVPVVVNIDTAATREKSEMAANEPAAHEMPIGKRISRKPASNQVERSTDLTSP